MDANSMAILVSLGGFLLMVFLRFPVAYAVTPPSVFCLLFRGHSLTIIHQQTVKDISSFSLMVVPFFTTMGCLMGPGGTSERSIVLANTCAGWIQGGMTVVNIVASYFFGGISGSASAGTASLGSILTPMMADRGCDDDFSIAVTITPSREGLLVSSNRNMVIYATTTGGISVGSLFLAGYIPRALLTVTLMIGSYIISVKRNYPKGEKFSITNLIKQLSVSFWTLAAVLIVVLGVIGGVFTATKSAAVAIIYSLIINVFIYEGLNWKGVWRVPGDSVDTLSVIMILIATFNIFGFCLTQLHVPILAASAITGMASSPILLTLLLNLILLILGRIMDMAPIIPIATPIPPPIAASINLDPIQFGIMTVPNCGIEFLTPPVGVIPFIGSTASKVPVEWVAKTTLPFYVRMIIILLLTTFIPVASM